MSVCVCVCVCVCVLSHVSTWIIACHAPLSMGIPKQEYWKGLPFPTPGDLPDLGVKPTFLASPALAGGFFITAPYFLIHNVILVFSLKQKQLHIILMFDRKMHK